MFAAFDLHCVSRIACVNVSRVALVGTRTPSDHAGQATRSWAEHPQGDGMRWVQNGQWTWEELWCW